MKVAGLSSVLVDCPGLQSPSKFGQRRFRFRQLAAIRATLTLQRVAFTLGGRGGCWARIEDTAERAVCLERCAVGKHACRGACPQAFWCSALAKPASPCFCFSLAWPSPPRFETPETPRWPMIPPSSPGHAQSSSCASMPMSIAECRPEVGGQLRERD